MTTLSLSSNQISGTISSQFGIFPNIDWLDLSNNILTKFLPSKLAQLETLTIMKLYMNQLNGMLSSILEQLLNL
jgi:Leucine-rich repeat (LRR) protein